MNIDFLPWMSDKPGWGAIDRHSSSKYPNRFVLSGCDHSEQIVEYMKLKTGMEYGFLYFDEEHLFVNQQQLYSPPCCYFFPMEERSLDLDITSAELIDLYWY